MQTVSAIEPGRRRGRFNIFVDGEFVVAVGEKVVAEMALRVGQSFAPERLAEVAGAEERRRAMDASARLLEIRPRAAKEIEQRLRQKGFEDETIREVIAALVRLKLIDDAEFARQWVESRSRARPKGARMLRAELAQKGVAKAAIDEAVAKVSSEDELDLARTALAARLPRAGLSEDREARDGEYRRLASFLQRRGFGWETAKAVLAEVFGREED